MAEDFPVGTAEGFGFSADVMSADCPSRVILQHMTSRWAALVMIALTEGGRLRFSQLKRRIEGVSERMLAQTLQVLEADGLVLRTAYEVVPPHVEYELTALGAGAGQRMAEVGRWIEANVGALGTGRRG